MLESEERQDLCQVLEELVCPVIEGSYVVGAPASRKRSTPRDRVRWATGRVSRTVADTVETLSVR
jgi:hypothetical protein